MKHYLTSIVLVLAWTAAEAAEEKGIWVKAGAPAQINVACTQVWHCRPATDVLHDESTKVVTTDNEITTGVCSAGDGPIDSCNVCVANEPEEKCLWHLEKK